MQALSPEAGISIARAMPWRRAMRHALMRFWLSLCGQAERKTRVVPYC